MNSAALRSLLSFDGARAATETVASGQWPVPSWRFDDRRFNQCDQRCLIPANWPLTMTLTLTTTDKLSPVRGKLCPRA